MKKYLRIICAVLLMAAMCISLTGCDLRSVIANGAGGVASTTVTEQKDPLVGVITAIEGNKITIQVFKKDAVTSSPAKDTSSKATTSYLVMQNFPIDQYSVTTDTTTYTVGENVPLFVPSGSTWKTAALEELKEKDLIVVYTDGVAGESVWKLR